MVGTEFPSEVVAPSQGDFTQPGCDHYEPDHWMMGDSLADGLFLLGPCSRFVPLPALVNTTDRT